MTFEIDIQKLTELLIDAREYAAESIDNYRALRNIDKIGEMFGLDLEKLSAEIDAQYDAWIQAQAERNAVNH